MFSVGTPSELSIELLNANSILQEPNNLFILETHISSSTVFSQQSPKPSGQEFALTETPSGRPSIAMDASRMCREYSPLEHGSVINSYVMNLSPLCVSTFESS